MKKAGTVVVGRSAIHVTRLHFIRGFSFSHQNSPKNLKFFDRSPNHDFLFGHLLNTVSPMFIETWPAFLYFAWIPVYLPGLARRLLLFLFFCRTFFKRHPAYITTAVRSLFLFIKEDVAFFHFFTPFFLSQATRG